jgi:hypothetical protein
MRTNEQLLYWNRKRLVLGIAAGVIRRHDRLDEVTLDRERIDMLPDTAEHKLWITTGRTNVEVTIRAHWFRDPLGYKRAIEEAVEAAFEPAKNSRLSELLPFHGLFGSDRESH